MREEVMYRVMGQDPMFKTWHISGKHMLIYFETDGGWIVSKEKAWPIRKGVLCFVGAGKYHYTMPSEPENYVRSKMFLHPIAFSRLQKLMEDNSMLHTLSGDSFIYAEIPEALQAETDRIFATAAERNTEKNGELIVCAAWMQLMWLIERYAAENTAPAKGFIGQAVEYISHHIGEPLDVEQISAAVAVSKYHFCRRFREATGLTVMRYVQHTRIVMAESLLRERHLSVAEVCVQCGFSNASHFSRVFREETGFTPLQYRKRNTR